MPLVNLWANDSAESQELVSLLQARGYQVDYIHTAGHEPIARTGFCVLSGYGNIRFNLR
jgi:hypothetical protein